MQNFIQNKKAHPRFWMGSVIVVSSVFLIAAALLIVNNGILGTMAAFLPNVRSESSASSDSSGGTSSTAAVTSSVAVKGTFAYPKQMEGAWLVAGTDYAVSSADNGQTVKTQIDTALTALAKWNFNTVLVPLQKDGKLLSSLSFKNTDGTAFDPVAYILQSARSKGLYAYGVIDLTVGSKGGFDPTTADGAKAIHNLVSEAVSSYAFDGYLLDNVGYAAGSSGSYAAYMQAAPGAGFETFMRESVTAAITDAVETIKAKNNNFYVGLASDAVWAHTSDDTRGSATKGVYASYTDGYADTLGWITDKLFDFALIKDEYATKNTSASFGTVLNWWADVCGKNKIPMVVSHSADKACGSEEGWKSPDQLAQQVLACQKCSVWSGSVFNSTAALLKNADGSTTALLGAFSKSLDEEYITRTLTFVSPTKTSVTTYESKITIRGSADPNFPLTMNGKAVPLTVHGFFAMDLSLSPGSNTFAFKHKGETVTYTIIYRIVLLKSVQPSSKLSLGGGTEINISAVARKGAKLYAKIGGTTIKMLESALQTDEDDTDAQSSDFINYAGTYTLPKSIRGKTQNLGTVKVYASYNGLSESRSGAQIVVNALPVPVTPSAPTTSPSASGTSTVSTVPGGGGSTVLVSNKKIVTVKGNYAMTFSGTTTDNWWNPQSADLPCGTADYVVKEVVGSTHYYLLGCGRRVDASDVSTYSSNGMLTSNVMRAGSVGVGSDETVVTLGATWRIPYNVRFLPQSYTNDTRPTTLDDYGISSFTATYVDITFYYTTSVSGTPGVSSSPLFTSAEWIKGGGNTYTLRLHLKKTGSFYGYSVSWGGNGITFTFNNPTCLASGGKPLAGKRIVLDPGHGGYKNGTSGVPISTGQLVYEKDLNLQYAKSLRDKLQKLGATVVMTRTTDILPDAQVSPPDIFVRTNYARNNGTDLFISIHMDGAGSSARGCTTFYFNEYSQPFAKAVSGRVDAAYRSLSGHDYGRKYKWMYYDVMCLKDCPSILVECGFMTNPSDLELLISSSYQDKFTQGMAQGIVDYFSTVSSTTFGSASYTSSATPSETATTADTVSLTSTAPLAAGILVSLRGRRRKRGKRRAA